MATDHRRILDTLPGLVWTAPPEGDIDFVNRCWSDYAGLASGEAPRDGWRSLVHPEDLPALLAGWRSILSAGEPGAMEARLRRHDGQHRRHLMRCNPLRDESGRLVAWHGTATNVDALRQAEQSLRRRALEFRSIVDSISIPVAVTTASGEVEGLNQPTLDYFGRTLEELEGVRRRPPRRSGAYGRGADGGACERQRL